MTIDNAVPLGIGECERGDKNIPLFSLRRERNRSDARVASHVDHLQSSAAWVR